MTDLTIARALLAGALDVSVEQLPDEPRIGACPGWDSLAHMRLVLAIEERTGRQLTTDELMQIDGINDVAKILQAANA